MTNSLRKFERNQIIINSVASIQQKHRKNVEKSTSRNERVPSPNDYKQHHFLAQIALKYFQHGSKGVSLQSLATNRTNLSSKENI